MPQRYTSQSSGSAASKFGQMLGEAFEAVIFEMIESYLNKAHPDYEILAPEEGKQIVALQTFGGTLRQLDTVVVEKETDDPVALLETKWLKDARHHNDKGAWILQLREVRKQYPTVRGAAAIMAGYWTEGVGVMLDTNAGIRMILVATDEEVYQTLQTPLNDYLGKIGAAPLHLDPVMMRKSYPRVYDLANFLMDLEERGHLHNLALQWLNFERAKHADGRIITGGDKVQQTITDLLAPLPPDPQIRRFELALQIDTGNTIYQEFDDMEMLIEFVKTYHNNPEAILKIITPGKRNSTQE